MMRDTLGRHRCRRRQSRFIFYALAPASRRRPLCAQTHSQPLVDVSRLRFGRCRAVANVIMLVMASHYITRRLRALHVP